LVPRNGFHLEPRDDGGDSLRSVVFGQAALFGGVFQGIANLLFV
jgi:hypothetical protein